MKAIWKFLLHPWSILGKRLIFTGMCTLQEIFLLISGYVHNLNYISPNMYLSSQEIYCFIGRTWAACSIDLQYFINLNITRMMCCTHSEKYNSDECFITLYFDLRYWLLLSVQLHRCSSVTSALVHTIWPASPRVVFVRQYHRTKANKTALLAFHWHR